MIECIGLKLLVTNIQCKVIRQVHSTLAIVPVAFKLDVFEELALPLHAVDGVDSHIESIITKCPYPPPLSVIHI